MDKPISFEIEKKLNNRLGRAGTIKTLHGEIKTPAFVAVGTTATVKALTPEQIKETGSQVILVNTYHLYLRPGEKVIKAAGGIHKFMNWNKPIMTDSGGFQVFSLGAAYGKKISKIKNSEKTRSQILENIGIDCKDNIKNAGQIDNDEKEKNPLAKIDEEGVFFKSPYDGSERQLTPEKSLEIQHDIGADIIFAFDECVSPEVSYEYQKEALERTHRWAARSLKRHHELEAANNKNSQSLFGVVQGGQFKDLRKESAAIIGKMGFDGFGIGGSFDKKDIGTAVKWVNEILPAEKPRHLLGIGEPTDLFEAVENGSDLFDCVAPTRIARNGGLYTKKGRINILNAVFKQDFSPIENDCGCYSCRNYTKAYISHLFRSEELLAYTLASIHNLFFLNSFVEKIRQSIFDDDFSKFKNNFLSGYKIRL